MTVRFTGTESLKATLAADDYGIHNLSFSPDGKRLAGRSNRTDFLWDIETGVVKLTLIKQLLKGIPIIAKQFTKGFTNV